MEITMRSTLLFLHLAGVIIWIGGMFFAHFCLRPVVAEQLPPPQRLPLLAGVLGRFFTWVAAAIALILLSGIGRMLNVGFASAPLHWHVMLSSGLVMVVIFAIITLRDFPKLKAGVAAQDWPTAGAAMNTIRQRVAINLGLGVTTVAIACFGAGF
jgi:uncharacterized membrane protein